MFFLRLDFSREGLPASCPQAQASKLPKQERCQLAAAAQAAAKRSAASAIRSSSPNLRKKQCKISLTGLLFLYFSKKTKLGELLIGNEQLLKPPQSGLLLNPSGHLHRIFRPVALKQYEFYVVLFFYFSKRIFREKCQLAAP